MKNTLLNRVLVTGASGFVGGHCVTELIAHGYEVRVAVRNPAGVQHLAGVSEVVHADLESDSGWADAAAGCNYVLHVASPLPLSAPEDENDVIRPAVDGTLRVLRASAASGTVKRVVVTSSTDAVRPAFSAHPDAKTLTEEDWADPAASHGYQKSKILAERAAWDFARADGGIELAVICPGMVLGPVQHAALSSSLEPVRRLLAREVPGVPRLGWATVDVRDLAVAQRLAMETPHAAGNRYICAGPHVWLRDIAKILSARYRVPTWPLPYAFLWAAGRFDPAIRGILDLVGQKECFSADKARRDLGWTTRPLSDTLFDTAASLFDYGLVKPEAAGQRSRLHAAHAPTIATAQKAASCR
jgi:nucleoside-diphosphate-sugar epimerase